MHDDILRELELAGTEVHARTLLVCSFAWRAPNSADHEWKSLEHFVSRAFASIFTSYLHHHQTSHTYSRRYNHAVTFAIHRQQPSLCPILHITSPSAW